MAAPKKVDYERIEPGWRAGVLSPAQLAAEYTEATGVSVSHTAIIKHFRKLGVPRDLSAKVHAKADAMVAQAMVTGKVSTETTVRDAEIIDDGATRVAGIRIGHRDGLKRQHELTTKLTAELERQTDNPETFEALLDLLAKGEEGEEPDAAKKRRQRLLDQWHKAMSLSARVDNNKKLAETRRILIDKEREAYGIGNDGPQPDDLTKALGDLISSLHQTGAGKLPIVRSPKPQ